MRVTWVSHGAGLGGAELCLWEALQGLAGAGVDQRLLLPVEGPLGARARSLGIATETAPYTWWVCTDYRPTAPLRLRRLAINLRAALLIAGRLRRDPPDLVVTNTLAIPSGAVAARLVGLPHAWYVHEFYGRDPITEIVFEWGPATSLRLMDRLSALVLANSLAVQEQLGGYISPDRLRKVYYAVLAPGSHPERESEGPVNLLLVGLLCHSKGQEQAIEALALLARRGVEARLTLLGHEVRGYRQRLEQQARSLGVVERVEFVPYTSDPHSRFAAADIVLMCSWREAFGRVTIEGMKAGKPVIGAVSGATPELVRDGETGLLYPPGDVAALADRLEALCRDRLLRERLGRTARDWATETFTLERYTADLLRIFGDAIPR